MITSLKTLYNSDKTSLDKFFKDEVVISEKLSTCRILFENKNGELIFYKKDYTKIDKIERSLNTIWEDALIEIPILCENVEIPEGYIFGVSYYPNTRTNIIPYEKIDKYILTDISKRTKKISRNLSENIVAEWSLKLHMGLPPVIYKGVLNEEQKQLLINYANKNFEFIKENDFSTFISENIATTYSKQSLIEGIIIKSYDKTVQLKSYEFELLSESYIKESDNKYIYDIIILYLNNYLKEHKLSFNKTSDNEQNYINIVCDIFNGFINNNKSSLISLNESLVKPKTYGDPIIHSNRFISNKDTLNLLNTPLYESLFYIMLNALRKTKKPNSIGVLSESDVINFNNQVEIIKNILNEENVIIKDISTKREITDIDNMKLIGSIHNTFDVKIKNNNTGLQQCILYVCDILTFTNSQLRNIEIFYNQFNLPVILLGLSFSKCVEGKRYFMSDNLIKAQLDILKETYPFIEKSMLLSEFNLKHIFEICRPEFEPVQMICDNNSLISDFKNQLFFEDKVLGGRINTAEYFDIIYTENFDKHNALRALEDGNVLLFKNITPPVINNLFNVFLAEYKVWTGQILK